MERKAEAERPAWGRRPHANSHARPGKAPGGVTPALMPGAPAALGLQRAARGLRPGREQQTRGPGRRSVLTGTDILAAAPGARAGSGAGRLGAPVRRAAQSPPRGVPLLSGFPAGSCALPAAGLSGGFGPPRACAASRRPSPSRLLPGGRVKGEDPGPRHFSVGPTRRGGSVSAPHPTFMGHLESRRLLLSHPVLETRAPTPHVGQPRMLGACPAVWRGSQSLCLKAIAGQPRRAPRNRPRCSR